MSYDDQKVIVAVRVRPKLDKANERYQVECIQKANDGEDKTIVVSQNEGKDNKINTFSFDRVYDQESTQSEFYQESCLELVDCALQGYDVTIFTYGQTGSGKTWTVLGKVGSMKSADDIITEDSGLFLRILADLFKYKSESTAVDVRISVSILEIYMEEFRDLLADSRDRAKNVVTLREIDNDVQMQNLITDNVDSIEEVYKLYKYAERNRMVTATNMNDVSSRSHCAFFLDIEQFEKSSNNIVRSRICLVDLAGSERVKKSEVEGIHLKEAQSINKSLSALGNVVNGLFLDKKHIPFRDSKLTRILKPSFVGKGKVLLIANLSPTQASCLESLSTLRFANRVKEMKAPSIQDDGVDRQKEFELLELMRQSERLSSYYIIATKVYDYQPQLSDFPYQSNYIGALETKIKDAQQTYGELVKKKEEEQKTQRERQLIEEIKKLTKEKAEEWVRKLSETAERLKRTKKQLATEKESGVRRIESLKETENLKQAELDELQRELSFKRVESGELRDEVNELKEKKERLEEEVRESQIKYQAQIEDYEKNWRSEEEAMNEKILQHDSFKLLFEAAVKLRTDQMRYLHLKQSLQNSLKHRDIILKRLTQHEIRAEVRDIVMEMADAAVNSSKVHNQSLLVKRRTEVKNNKAKKPNESKPLELRTPKVLSDIAPRFSPFVPASNTEIIEVLKKSYPYDRKNILSLVVDYLKSGSLLTLHTKNRKSRRYLFTISEDLQSLCWKDENYASMENVTVYTLPLFSIQDILLGQYSDTFRMSLSSREEEFFYSFSLEHTSQRTIDLCALNCFDFEAWILTLSAILGIKAHWSKPLSSVGDEQLLSLLKPNEIEMCSRHHIRAEIFLFIQNLVEELRTNNLADLSRGQLRVLSQLDVIRSDVLLAYFYPTPSVVNEPKVDDN